MLGAWGFAGIAKTLGARSQSGSLEAALEPVAEPAPPCCDPAIAYRRRPRFLEPAPKQPSAREHAVRLLEWIRANIDAADGPITYAAMLEFYTEMLIELDWTPRPWNPVAHQFRLLTTGSRKVYAWITTTTGALHRLRVYPIPTRAVGAESAPETKSTQAGSRIAPKLRRAA